MLKELRLNNLAIIKHVDLELSDNFVVLTGETGAGKSIILDGISLLIGERSSVDMIRTGEESLLAEGVFELSENQIKKLNTLDFEINETELIISRYIDRNSKSKILVNGMRMTVTRLKMMMENILDLVGQHEHQYLLNKNFHLDLLDKFLKEDGTRLKKEIKVSVDEVKSINKKIEQIKREKEKISDKKDVYEFQVKEISELDLIVGEDIELENEYKILFNSGKISEKLNDSMHLLKNFEYSIFSNTQKIRKNFESLSNISLDYQNFFERFDKIYYEVEDIAYSIEDLLDSIESNDTRLDKVIARIDAINKLKLKYGSTIEEILEYKDDIEQKLELINLDNTDLTKLEEEKTKSIKNYFKNSEKLREIRKEISNKLEKYIDGQLTDLKMENSKFKVKFLENESIRYKGIDDIEFMISTNVGEDLKPLSKVASGGEISRVMLALKVIFSRVDNISVLIFDEIDTGIAGETVKKVAEKLKNISKKVQVICVTHSPQIAAKGDQQFFIKKEIENNFTETKVSELSEEERIIEIARMLSGDDYTETSINHAKEIMGLV